MIKNLGLLTETEKIVAFYSEYRNEVAGNFYTDKRVAQYWIDKRNSLKNQKNFAFYKDIISITPNYNTGITYAKYVLIEKSDKRSFKVYFDGTKSETENFVKNMITTWKKNKLKN